MTLYLYNSLRRKKELFQPIDSNNIKMYVCGPTVYDAAHLGNARPVVVFDVLYRLLKHLYPHGKVIYVRNITDVDDKIIEASKKSGESIQELTVRTTELYHQDMAHLYALPPTIEPKATEHIQEMICLIETLIEKGHAYAHAGHVLFEANTDHDYGSLAGVSRDAMIDGARVEVAPYKKNPEDFVLWKPSSADMPGWNSPWGFGRPGWHIECSAMSQKYLGENFDIHGGGIDLIFPHHENECAQSRCAHNQPLANFWIHNGHLMVNGKKMSKSEGNFFTVQDLLKTTSGEVLRLAMLMTHYHQPLDWTDNRVHAAEATINRFYQAVGNVELSDQISTDENVLKALQDNLNTPAALLALEEIVSKINISKNDQEKTLLQQRLKASANILGLLHETADGWFQGKKGKCIFSSEEIQAKINERDIAKQNKNYEKADAIRRELDENGIILEDVKNRESKLTITKWKFK